jgi:hypothetical protein
MKITVESLLATNACDSEVNRFAAEWPNGAEVTLANCQRATVLQFDFDWAAGHLLSVQAREAYDAAMAPARAAFRAAMAQATEAYDAAAAIAPVTAAFRAAMAQAFFEACGKPSRSGA